MSTCKACAYSQETTEATLCGVCIASMPIELAIHGPERKRIVEVHGSLKVPMASVSQDALRHRNEDHFMSPAGMD